MWMHFVDLGKRFEPFRTGKRPSNILWFAYLLTEPPPSRRNSLHVRMIAADVVLVNDGFSRHAEAKDVVLEWRDMHTMHVEIGRVDVAVRVLGPGRVRPDKVVLEVDPQNVARVNNESRPGHAAVSSRPRVAKACRLNGERNVEHATRTS